MPLGNRTRIRDLKAEAAEVLDSAKAALVKVHKLIDELRDGATFTLMIGGKPLPLGIRIDPREPEDREL